MIKVLFVCHGNICRSTMAESVFTYLVTQAGLASHFEINSAATSREEIGNPPHYGTVDSADPASCASDDGGGLPVL